MLFLSEFLVVVIFLVVENFKYFLFKMIEYGVCLRVLVSYVYIFFFKEVVRYFFDELFFFLFIELVYLLIYLIFRENFLGFRYWVKYWKCIE